MRPQDVPATAQKPAGTWRAAVRLRHMDDDHIERTENEARAGTTPHIVRYVLGFSLTLAILAMAAILISYFRT